MDHANPWTSNTDHLDHTTTMKSRLLVTQTELYPDRNSPSHHLQKYLSSEKHRNPFFIQKGWTARYDCNRNTSMNQVTLDTLKGQNGWTMTYNPNGSAKLKRLLKWLGKEIIEFKWFGIISQTY